MGKAEPQGMVGELASKGVLWVQTGLEDDHVEF